MTNRDDPFSEFKQLADAIVTMFGPSCEVAIHDLRDLRKSLVYIKGEVTGRKIGAPATDLLVKALHRNNSAIDDMYNYKTTTPDGRSIKSSTILLRNENKEAIGAFCMNYDTTDIYNATQTLSSLLNHNIRSEGEIQETFTTSITETIEVLFEQALLEIGKQPTSMTTAEKVALTSLLEEQGVFQMKGAVNHVARLTGVSKYTIYNYLKKIRKIPSNEEETEKETFFSSAGQITQGKAI